MRTHGLRSVLYFVIGTCISRTCTGHSNSVTMLDAARTSTECPQGQHNSAGLLTPSGHQRPNYRHEERALPVPRPPCARTRGREDALHDRRHRAPTAAMPSLPSLPSRPRATRSAVCAGHVHMQHPHCACGVAASVWCRPDAHVMSPCLCSSACSSSWKRTS